MKIFLFDSTCLSYRIHVYKFLNKEFKKYGYELTIFYDKDKTEIEESIFEPLEYSFRSIYHLHRKKKPDISIFFIWLSYKWSLPFLIFMRLFMPTKSIVWSKGINIKNINQPLKNTLYYVRQFFADGLILYSDFEKQFIVASKKKIFVANNTINQHVYKKIIESKDILRNKHGIKHKKNVLFLGRIEQRKRLDLLIEAFVNELTDYGLIIIGPGLNAEDTNTVNNASNIYYFGPIYDINTLSEFYALSDIFCIPGAIGLAVNESFLYGLPVVTADVNSDPKLISSEPIMLIDDGVNSKYFKQNEEKLSQTLKELLENDDLRASYSVNARKTFEEKAKIEYMAKGFLNAINYVKNRK